MLIKSPGMCGVFSLLVCHHPPPPPPPAQPAGSWVRVSHCTEDPCPALSWDSLSVQGPKWPQCSFRREMHGTHSALSVRC